ncbi:MAG: hypothetical protein Q8P70_00055 [bacterium]|nr:hypothetical protein [bacterium]
MTERQFQVLTNIVSSYIKTALPVSSQYLEQESRLGVSPATIRNEMKELTEKGFVTQPHTSAGRVPTEQGYRAFVDSILRDQMAFPDAQSFSHASEEGVHALGALAKSIAQETSGLVVLYTAEYGLFWQEGWGGVLREPEFRDQEHVAELTCLVRGIEENIEQISQEQEFRVYIGRENPFFQAQRLSMIMGTTVLGGKGLVAVVGPMRMAYIRNIRVMRSLL